MIRLGSSIRTRLAATFALSLAIIMLLACWGLIWYGRRSAESSADAVLTSAAWKARSEMLDEGESRSSSKAIEEFREDYRADNLAMVVIGEDGRVVAKSQSDVPAWPTSAHGKWRTLSASAGGNTIVIGMPWEKIENGLRYHSVVLLCLSLFVILVASVGAWVLVGWTLSPIASLSRQANAASADSLCVSLAEPSEDAEIVDLVATLNGLLERLSATASAKGRFYSSASHEMRTPLQALSGHLELALTKDRSSDEYRCVIEEAYKQTRRLISLVRDLLFLYQLDSAASQPAKELTNPAAVCERALTQMKPLIEQRGLSIETKLSGDAEVISPPTHIEMLVRNLIENAVKYAEPEGRVSLDLSMSGSTSRLVVYNECSSTQEWNPEQMFEPFSRPDPSRSPQTGGTGLGLAICRAITTANGWSLSLDQAPSGVCVTVVFGAD